VEVAIVTRLPPKNSSSIVLGHDARLTLSTYGHVIDELDGSPQIPCRGRDPGRTHGRCVSGVSQEANHA
jgi:hypothetical protein